MNKKNMAIDYTNTATRSARVEGGAQERILTCAGVGFGGSCPRRPPYLAGPFDPTGLGCAHVS